MTIRTIIAAPLILALGACTTANGELSFADRVQQWAANLCLFVPTVETIVEISGVLEPETEDKAFGIAEVICDSITPPPPGLTIARARAAAPAAAALAEAGPPIHGYYEGVPIYGQFIQ